MGAHTTTTVALEISRGYLSCELRSALRPLYSLLSTLYSLLSTLYSLLSTLYSLLSTLYSDSLLSALYSLLSTPYSLLSTLYSTLYSPLSTLTLYSLLATLYSLLSTFHSLLFLSALCSLLSTLYSTLSTLYSLLYTIYSLLYTLYSLLSTLYSDSLLSALYSTPYSLLSTLLLLSALYSLLPTPYSLLSTLFSLLSTLYSPRRPGSQPGNSPEEGVCSLSRVLYSMCTCVSAGNKCSLTRRDVVSGSHRLLHVLVLVEVLREPEVDQLHASHVPRRLHEPVLQLEVAMYDAMPMHVTNLIVAATAKTRIAARSIRLCELHRAYRLMEISRALYGAVFPIGSVRFGAVRCGWYTSVAHIINK